MAIMFGLGINDVNIDLSGSKIEAQEATNIIQREANKTQVSDVVSAAVGLGTTILKQQQLDKQVAIRKANQQGVLDANEAKVATNELFVSDAYREGNNSVKYSLITNMLTEATGQDKEGTTKSDAYVNAMKGYISSKYASATNGMMKETKTSILDFSAAAYQAWMESPILVGEEGQQTTRAIAGNTISEFNKEYSDMYTRFGVTPKEVGMMVGSDLMRQGNEIILEAETDEELAIAILDAEDLTEGLEDNTASLSKNAEVIALFNKAKTERNAAIRVVEGKIVLNAKKRLAEVDKGDNIEDPLAVNKDIEIAYKDPVEQEKKKQEYQKTHSETIEVNTWFAENFDVTGKHKSPAPTSNPQYKKKQQQRVTGGLVEAWENNQPSLANDIVNNNPGFSSDFGKHLLGIINGTKDNEELIEIVDYVKLLNPSVASRMFSDSEYSQLMGIEGLSIAYPDKSITDIRGMIKQAEGEVGVGNMGLSEMKNFARNATKLGELGNRYRTAVNYLMKIDTGVAEDKYKDIYEHFSNLLTENSEGLKVDESNGKAGSMEALDVEAYNKQHKQWYPNTASIKPMGNGLEIHKDADGWNLSIINSKPDVQASNYLTEIKILKEKKKQKAKVKGEEGITSGVLAGAGQGFEGFTRTFTDNFLNFFIEIPEVGGKLIDKFTDHLYDSMDESQKDYFESLKGAKLTDEGVPSHGPMRDILESQREVYDTENIQVEINNPSYTEQEQIAIPYMLADNKKKVMMIDVILNELSPDGIPIPKDAVEMTHWEAINYGPDDAKGMGATMKMDNKDGSPLPRGYVRKAGTIIKFTD